MSLDIFAQFATDETLENNGTWFEVGGGTSFLIGRAGNRKYGKVLTKEVERNRKVLDLADEVADKKSEEIMIGVMAESILLGWKTVADDVESPTALFKGEVLEYSVENAKRFLAVKDFRKWVAEKADDTEAFRIKQEIEQGEA